MSNHPDTNQNSQEGSPERNLPDVLGASALSHNSMVGMPSAREVLTAGEDELLAWAVTSHPDTEVATGAHLLRRDAKPGDVFHFAKRDDTSEQHVANVAARQDEKGSMPAFIYIVEGQEKREHSLWLKEAFVAESAEELTSKIDSQEQFVAHKRAVIEASPIGEGALSLTNEFGGFAVGSEGALEETSVDMVARALIAHRLGLETIRDAVNAGLVEPVTAYAMAGSLAPLFEEVHKTATILDQLPTAVRPLAGAPLIDQLVQNARDVLQRMQPELFLLAAVRNSSERAHEFQEIVRAQERIIADNSTSVQISDSRDKLSVRIR